MNIHLLQRISRTTPSAGSPLVGAALVVTLLALAGCERERRDFETPPHVAAAASVPSDSVMHPGPTASEAGPPASAAPSTVAAPSSAPSAPPAADAAASPASAATPASTGPLVPAAAIVPNPAGHEHDEQNAFDVSQGKRLFRWFNCNGCHGAGGGNMGPALSDAEWRYGASPAQIAATIMQGRPNGMPSFAGRLTDDQLWQIVAYVRSLSGQLRSDVAPSRGDTISPGEPESRRKPERPRPAASS
jgi:cytochrome c oxidase cbb3-type subunit III